MTTARIRRRCWAHVSENKAARVMASRNKLALVLHNSRPVSGGGLFKLTVSEFARSRRRKTAAISRHLGGLRADLYGAGCRETTRRGGGGITLRGGDGPLEHGAETRGRLGRASPLRRKPLHAPGAPVAGELHPAS